MNQYFDESGNLLFKQFLFLNGGWRAVLDGYGIDDWGYTYDIKEDGHTHIAHIHNKKGFSKKKIFTRRENAKIWLTNFYKDHNE